MMWRLDAQLALVVLVFLVSAFVPNFGAVANGQTPATLDCTGNIIYTLRRGTTGNTTASLYAVNVSAMGLNTTSVSASSAGASTPSPGTNPGANALGISDGGVIAWALEPQAPTGTNNALTFRVGRSTGPTTHGRIRREISTPPTGYRWERPRPTSGTRAPAASSPVPSIRSTGTFTGRASQQTTPYPEVR
jgi:hypothetical protein